MTFSGSSYQKDSFTIQSPNAFLLRTFNGALVLHTWKRIDRD